MLSSLRLQVITTLFCASPLLSSIVVVTGETTIINKETVPSSSSSSSTDVPTLYAYNGTTPALDGILTPGEWDDAFYFSNISNFDPQFDPVLRPQPNQPVDLDIELWVKHDNEKLYFAFRVTDDVLYYFQTSHFMPGGNNQADNLTQTGWPWFGDEIEVLLNPSNTYNATNQTVSGDGTSSQVVCNLHKSRLGGIGIGGLLEGEPRSSNYAWNNYHTWIENGGQVAATGININMAPNNGSYYVFEWGISFNPCLEVQPRTYYNATTMNYPVPIGLNIAIGDVDNTDTVGPVYGLRHEMWFSGSLGNHTNLSAFGKLVLEPGNLPQASSSFL